MVPEEHVSEQIQKNITELADIGFKVIDSQNLLPEAKFTKVLEEKFHIYSTLIDDNIQSVDIIFDKKTGNIIGWKNTEHTKKSGRINLKVHLPSLNLETDENIVVTFFTNKLQGMIKDIAKFVDTSIKEHEELQWFNKSLELKKIADSEKGLMSGQRVLLLVHGIFSTTKDAFQDLLSCESGSFYDQLSNIYGKNIIAYDHFTLCKSTKENASDLLALLPNGIKLDIVSHSRGAGVVRFLLEIDENIKKLNNVNITVGTVCFVAGACEGSPLASKKAGDDLFKILTQLMVFSGLQPWTKAIGFLIRATVKGVQNFPGVKAMNPDEDEIKKMLKETKNSAAKQYAYIRANFDSKNSILKLVDEVLIDKTIFNNSRNDCIVPWDGAGVTNDYANTDTLKKVNLLDLPKDGGTQNEVWHINFFREPKVCECLINALK